jgi:subtilisin family serine protease
MDGRTAVDIAAPDNPDVPLGFESSLVERGWEPGWFLTFGGTSGAAAHVAGGAAAIRGVSPGLTADSLEESLQEAASSQDLTPAPDSLPSTAWGYGRLDVGGALGISDGTPNTRPTFEVHESGFDPVVVEVDTSDPDGNDVSVRFDVGYDGTWDTEWGETRKIDISMSGSTERSLRVAVRDSRGGLRERLVEVSSSARVDTADVEPIADAGEPKTRSTGACCQTTGGAVLFEIWLVLFGLFGQVGLGWRRS